MAPRGHSATPAIFGFFSDVPDQGDFLLRSVFLIDIKEARPGSEGQGIEISPGERGLGNPPEPWNSPRKSTEPSKGPYSARSTFPRLLQPSQLSVEALGAEALGTLLSAVSVWSCSPELAVPQVESKLRRWGWTPRLFDLAPNPPMAVDGVKRGSTSLKASFLHRGPQPRPLPARFSTFCSGPTVNTRHGALLTMAAHIPRIDSCRTV